jgi:hypothetical protein
VKVKTDKGGLDSVGSSEGFIFNKEAKERLNLKKGDTLYLTDALGGELRITVVRHGRFRQLGLGFVMIRHR